MKAWWMTVGYFARRGYEAQRLQPVCLSSVEKTATSPEQNGTCRILHYARYLIHSIPPQNKPHQAHRPAGRWRGPCSLLVRDGGGAWAAAEAQTARSDVCPVHPACSEGLPGAVPGLRHPKGRTSACEFRLLHAGLHTSAWGPVGVSQDLRQRSLEVRLSLESCSALPKINAHGELSRLQWL